MPANDTKLRWGPIHVNSNIICAIDIRIGGENPIGSDLLEVVCIPLNHSYKMHREFKMFQVKIRPSWRVDRKLARLNEHIFREYEQSPHDAIGSFSLFEYWVKETLELKENKKLIPLVWDWGSVKPWIEMWCGGSETFNYYFHESVRDMLPVLNFINDRCDFWGEDVKFKHPTMYQLLERNEVSLIDKNSCPANCKALIDAHYQMLRGYIPGFNQEKVEFKLS